MPFSKLPSNKLSSEQRSRARLQRKEARAQMLQRRKDSLRASSFTYTALADGEPTGAEVRFAHARGVKLDCSNKGQSGSGGVDIRALRGVPTAAFNITARRVLLRELRDLCLCDGPLNPAEEAALESIAEALQISSTQRKAARATRSSDWSHKRTRNKHSRAANEAAAESIPRIPWCYEFLGCHPTDSDQTIKATYRRLAVRYHPDKHSSSAASPEKIRAHVEAFQKLQTAYQEIQMMRTKKPSSEGPTSS
jgi:DnaJ-domain-containing protein 1